MVTKSSHTVDMYEHIDYWLAMSSQGVERGVDVKATFQMNLGGVQEC